MLSFFHESPELYSYCRTGCQHGNDLFIIRPKRTRIFAGNDYSTDGKGS